MHTGALHVKLLANTDLSTARTVVSTSVLDRQAVKIVAQSSSQSML